MICLIAAGADDETDRASTRSSKSRSSSVPAHKGRNAFSTPKPPAGKHIILSTVV